MTDQHPERPGDGPDDRPQYGIRLTPEQQAEHQARLDRARQERESRQGRYGQQPQYGQPGQPGRYEQQDQPSPYGRPSPYGYPPQPGQPGQPGPQPFGPIERPATIDRSYWLILAAGLAFVLIEALSLFSPTMGLTPEMMDAYRQQTQAAGVEVDIEALLPTIRVVAGVLTVVMAGLYWLIATGIRRGSNAARIVGTILAVMSLTAAFGLGLVYVALGVAGIVFAYLQPSSEYLRAKAWERAMRR